MTKINTHILFIVLGMDKVKSKTYVLSRIKGITYNVSLVSKNNKASFTFMEYSFFNKRLQYKNRFKNKVYFLLKWFSYLYFGPRTTERIQELKITMEKQSYWELISFLLLKHIAYIIIFKLLWVFSILDPQYIKSILM